MHTAAELWALVLEHLKEEYSETALETWLHEVTAAGRNEDTLLLRCPNEFKRHVLDRFYRDAIEKQLSALLSRRSTVRILPAAPGQAATPDPFTFETFVVGDSNRQAYTAAKAVAEADRPFFNPLVICGGPGLGKTHLLGAIAAAARVRDPSLSIVQVKSDDFTGELISAICRGAAAEFRDKYRTADLLLMDDLQYIAGKEQTQEEFCHTFDRLYESGRSIVLALDRPLRELPHLEQRLHDRFGGGLTVEITEPDYETRLALVRRKAEQRELLLSEGDAAYIAEHVTGSVRTLKGVLNRIRALRELEPAAALTALIREAVPLPPASAAKTS